MPMLKSVSPSGAVTATTPNTAYRRNVIVDFVMNTGIFAGRPMTRYPLCKSGPNVAGPPGSAICFREMPAIQLSAELLRFNSKLSAYRQSSIVLGKCGKLPISPRGLASRLATCQPTGTPLTANELRCGATSKPSFLHAVSPPSRLSYHGMRMQTVHSRRFENRDCDH
jgi:hypothetical protein